MKMPRKHFYVTAEGRKQLQKILQKGSVHDKTPSEVDVKTQSLIYSRTTQFIYCTDGSGIERFVWENNGLVLKNIRSPRETGEFIHSMALASQSLFEDSLYLSVVFGSSGKKSVLQVSGPNFENELKLKLDEIKEKCDFWEIACNPSQDILLIHPQSSDIVYVHAFGSLRKISLEQSGIKQRVAQMQIIGNKLVLGNSRSQSVTVCDLVVTKNQCMIDGSKNWGPVSTFYGKFAALKPSRDPSDIYIFGTTNGTSVSTFKYGESVSEPLQTVDLKTVMTPLLAVAHESNENSESLEASLLLIGRNEDKYLCAVEVKQKRTPAGNPGKDKGLCTIL